MAFQISSLAPAKWGATVLPVVDVTFSPGINQQSIKHSGHQHPTITVKSRAEPRFTLRIPFAIAYATFGVVASEQSTFEVYSTTFGGGIVSGSSIHGKWSASTSCKALAMITGFSVSNGGIMYADVEIVMLSNDGEANPVTFVQNASLPTLSAQPALHTMGPVYVNGSALPGANSWSVSTGKSFTVPANDGDLFPTSAAVIDEVSTISVGHNDPLAALASIGLTGSSISADVVCYASGYSSGIVAKTGSVSVTIGTGDIRPSPMSLSQGSLASIGIDVSPISSNGTTYPLTISTSATIP